MTKPSLLSWKNMDTMVLHKGETFEKVFFEEKDVNLHIVQEEGSRVKIHVINIHPHSNHCNKIVVEQLGAACSTEIYALAYVRDRNCVTTETHVIHQVGGGYSNQLVKYVLCPFAQGEFVGDLKIAKDAQQTEAHQTNRNLILSENAVMRTRPQLEIYADDVQATHGASTGQLDESAIFYMRQRGLSAEQARQMLIVAFMKEVLQTISDEQLRDELMDSLDRIVQ